MHSTTRLLWHKPRGCRTYYLRLPPYLQCSFYTTKRKRQLIFNPWVACKNEYLFVLYYMYLVDLLLVFFLLLSFLCLFSGIHFHLPHFRNSCSQIRHPDKLEDTNTCSIIWINSINSKTCKKISSHKNYPILSMCRWNRIDSAKFKRNNFCGFNIQNLQECYSQDCNFPWIFVKHVNTNGDVHLGNIYSPKIYKCWPHIKSFHTICIYQYRRGENSYQQQ